jgi:hypothetical protein
MLVVSENSDSFGWAWVTGRRSQGTDSVVVVSVMNQDGNKAVVCGVYATQSFRDGLFKNGE